MAPEKQNPAISYLQSCPKGSFEFPLKTVENAIAGGVIPVVQ